MAMHCELICQNIFSTVGDRQEGRDLNEKTLAADSSSTVRIESSGNGVLYRSSEK